MFYAAEGVRCSAAMAPKKQGAWKETKVDSVRVGDEHLDDDDDDADSRVNDRRSSASSSRAAPPVVQPPRAGSVHSRCQCEVCLKIARNDGFDWFAKDADLRGKPFPVGTLCADCGGYLRCNDIKAEDLKVELKSKKKRDAILTNVGEFSANKANPDQRSYVPARVYEVTSFESSMEDRPTS